jgi:hypothetical protein
LGGFEFEARRSTIGVIQISEGLRLVGFEFEARRGRIGGVQISEGQTPPQLPLWRWHHSSIEAPST